MRFLYCGDIMGRSGRKVVCDSIPALKEELGLDFVIVNGENAAHGFGITQKICTQFFDAGIDAITLGNHSWDQREIMNYIDQEPRLLRPLNYMAGTPGRGLEIYSLADGRKILIAQVMGRLFMEELDDPFQAITKALEPFVPGRDFQAALVDVHAEATSEKMAMGQYLDGRVSLVAGTHSHIPTADAQIFPYGTAYITDVGMCGDYDSVIGMEKTTPIQRFTGVGKGTRLQPATGDATLCAVFVETDDQTGLALKVAPVRLGGRLSPTRPQLAHL